MRLPDQKTFEENKEGEFLIQFLPEQTVSCRIKEIVSSKVPSASQNSQQFSVVFSNEIPTVFEQGVYSVAHKELGDFELFLVPIFGDENGVHYEAVFT